MTAAKACARLVALTSILILTAAWASAAPFAAYVIDARSGKSVYAQNADAKLHPASLTKMMTLYLAFESIERGRVSLDSKILISSNAASEPPSKLGLRAGQRIELRYLIRAAAVKSANDAATAIAEGLAGSVPAFAARMNRTARALGMRNTHFKNANGLTQSGHYSSARDMTVLGRRLFYDYPQYYSIFSRRSADAGIARVTSTNRRFLDAYEGADGIKTGYTRASGFNLTASAQRGSKRVVATVMGGKSTAQRNQIMAQLLDAGFGRAPRRAEVIRPDPPAYLAEETPARQASTRRVVVATEPARNATLARPAAAASTAAASTSRRQQAFNSPRPRARPARIARAATTSTGVEPTAIEAALAMASTASNIAPQTQVASARSGASSPRPAAKPRSGGGSGSTAQVTLASASPETRPAAKRETVSRGSFGSGNWSVSIGVYNTKGVAERALVRTSLAETGALDEARRRVLDTRRGWEARFQGLSRDSAWLTCKRLAARNDECRVISP